jgi:hypothetical protein
MKYNMSEERIKKLNRIVTTLREKKKLILYITSTIGCFSKKKTEDLKHLLRVLNQEREWFEGYICGYTRVIFENRKISEEEEKAIEEKILTIFRKEQKNIKEKEND